VYGIHCPAPDHGRLLWECSTTFPIGYRHIGGWSILSGRNYTRSLIEAERMRQLARDCETELQEIDAIEAYRKDEDRAAHIRVEARE
jgi:hypothetical protein